MRIEKILEKYSMYMGYAWELPNGRRCVSRKGYNPYDDTIVCFWSELGRAGTSKDEITEYGDIEEFLAALPPRIRKIKIISPSGEDLKTFYNVKNIFSMRGDSA